MDRARLRDASAMVLATGSLMLERLSKLVLLKAASRASYLLGVDALGAVEP